jgi:methylmalonyl-CoA/ethylmalonyl-CoA epimerase
MSNEMANELEFLIDDEVENVREPAAVRAAARLSDLVMGIDHIALAVQDLGAATTWVRDVLGFALIEKRETHGKTSGMKSAVLRTGSVTIVLTEGIGETSQTSQFVRQFGAGVQHVAFRVRDIARTADIMRSQGLEFSSPQLDSDQLSQIFSTRNEATGLMVELIERQGGFEGFRDENVQRLFDSLESRNLF